MLSLLSYSNRCRNWAMRCRNAERRIRAAHGAHGKGIFGLSLTLRPEGLPAVNVANKMGFPSIWKRPNLWLFQQHVEVSTRTAAFVCFLIAFAQDSLLFPAGLKGLPIHRTIVINIPIIYKDPHCGMDYHTPQNIPVLRCYHVSTMAQIGFSPLWDLSPAHLQDSFAHSGDWRVPRECCLYDVEMKGVRFHCSKFARTGSVSLDCNPFQHKVV